MALAKVQCIDCLDVFVLDTDQYGNVGVVCGRCAERAKLGLPPLIMMKPKIPRTKDVRSKRRRK